MAMKAAVAGLLAATTCANAQNITSIFDFTDLVDIHGNPTNTTQYAGNVALVINVASFWGETAPQYTAMSQLFYQFRDEKFVILAFPCNQYENQEPNSNAWIENFVQIQGPKHTCGLGYCNWNGTFPYPMFAKANVKPDWCTADPSTSCTASSKECCSKNDAVWKWLAELYPGQKNEPSWNFAGKHLFDKTGKPVKYINDGSYDPTKLAPLIQSLL